MGKKTMMSLASKGYTITEGKLTNLTKGERRAITFDKRIILLLIRFTMSGGQKGDVYYYNPNVSFWKNSNLTSLDSIMSPFSGYIYNTAIALTATYTSDYSVELYNPHTTMPTLEYIAILEDDSVGDDPMFLLAGTMLYTDGTPSAEIEGAIQTIESDKYKIKADVLLTITGATYINISN